MPTLASDREHIALVGRSLRFPGANSPSELWELLCKPRDMRSSPPQLRVSLDGYYHPDGDHHGASNARESYFIEQDHRVFDAAFFGISPVEAEAMDPQQRILLELVYEAMESAGLTIDSMRGSRTSVFVGLMSSDFSAIHHTDVDTVSKYAVTGAASSILSNRISYIFDWKGASMTIDTACSSSLVAVHQAVHSLRSGESEVAVVAGANLILSPEPADGYARGDGFAVVILKTLSQALRDGDHIMSVIRDTMVNMDGRTAGLTTPSASSQAALIRETYARAGLDCRVTADRCQYFEAHGTGTPTGDPIEAEAVQTAFFPRPNDSTRDDQEPGDCLYVGSIKTVTGHMEGCAGLGGLLKASLAVENGVIPPNMHFDTLSPLVEPFYHHMEVPTRVRAWPDIAPGSPRRASVNSFGFGGTNAHAIVENYTQTPKISQRGLGDRPGAGGGGPFVFSANSHSSLLAMVQAFAGFLETNSDVDLLSFAWMLQARRTVLPVKVAFPGVTQARLLDALRDHLHKTQEAPADASAQSRRFGSKARPKMLGIFTGQGAQWPQMGRELVLASPLFGQVLDRLQDSLDALPDPPEWSLKAELLANPASSRVSEATVGQPLCTAVQVALVDLVRRAGISFASVVGHSSGEIAAAYAAGFLSASDAIRVAYYRGYHGIHGGRGAMMTVEMSFGEALELCQSSRFAGRLVVAASNSATSVTLSGDADAVQEAQALFGEEKRPAKLLRVDRAYHSHHMRPSVEPYIRSLRACNVQAGSGLPDCVWISSVTQDRVTAKAHLDLGSRYWADNMMQPVLFSQAVERAMWNVGPFDFMVEIGPHPTLRAPTTQTAADVAGSPVPYCALLKRCSHDVESLCGALGHIWAHLGAAAQIDFDGYRSAFAASSGRSPQPALLQNVPRYPWDHGQIHWKESRQSRNARLRGDPIHELLGRRRPDDSAHETRWRNIMRLEELPWLRGHSFQGQILFPAAGYVSMAVEACRSFVRGRSVMVAEIRNMDISRALLLDESTAGTEVIFTLRRLEETHDRATADFICSSCPNRAEAEPEVNATGQISVVLADVESPGERLPPHMSAPKSMLPIDLNRFYGALGELGLNYAGLFRGLKKVQRTTCASTASASWPAPEIGTFLLVHPALLDVGFQAIFASVGSVATIHTPYLPRRIHRIEINASLAEPGDVADTVGITVDVYTTQIDPPSPNRTPQIHADVDIADGDRLRVQVEGLSLAPISGSDPSNDRCLFYQTVWDVDISSGAAAPESESRQKAVPDEARLAELLERLSHVYLRELYAQTPRESIATFAWYHQRLFEYMEDTFSHIDNARHPIIKKEWAADTRQQIFAELAAFPETIDLLAANAVAKHFPAVLAGEVTMLEVLTTGDMLTRLYDDSLALSREYNHIAEMARQIAHRYPRLQVVEVGAGTGATTSRVLDAVDGAFALYVYTDVSSGFLEKAKERFSKYAGRMEFRVFNVEDDPVNQGLAAHSFDLVVASGVLHATGHLRSTLANVRRLLRPGGYLLLLEPTGSSLRVSYVMGGLPGWWLGGSDGRRLFPGITPIQWDDILRDTGFSGVDTVLHDSGEPSKHVYSTILSQAVDDDIAMLRQPLLSLEYMPEIQQLTIVGGRTLPVHKLSNEIHGLLRPWKQRIVRAGSLETLGAAGVSPGVTVLCLAELDEPLFESLTEESFRWMKQLFSHARNVLWVTRRCRMDNPYSNMTVGVARVLLNETPHIDLQMLDISSERGTVPGAKTIAEALLRLVMKDALGPSVLWTTEPELALENETLLIPRLLPDRTLNDRLNSSWRTLQTHVSATSSVVDVCHRNGSYHLLQGPSLHTWRAAVSSIAIRTDLSLLHPVEVTAGVCLYLCLGSVAETGQRVIAFALSNSSVVCVRQDWTQECEVPVGEEADLLQSVTESIVALNILSSVPAGGLLLLHQPEPSIADRIARLALSVDVKVVCTTTALPLPRDGGWIHIHTSAPLRQTKALIPEGVSKFVNFNEGPHDGIQRRIRASISPFCSEADIATLFRDKVNAGLYGDATVPGESLKRALADSKFEVGPGRAFHSVMAKDLGESDSALPRTCIVDWRQQDTYQVVVRPQNPRHLFSGDKTYLLFGLTGDLGQSLGRWMILGGARNVVLASRRGEVPSLWLDEMRGAGADVRVFPVDITNKEALSSVHAEVRRTMPPIGGVVNGAMVLSDVLFADMTFEAMTRVLEPKVAGTKNLDDLFRGPELDFFVMFSSVSAVAGYRGQANYAAANMFMAGLATRRRREGLAASVLDIGMLTEIGYVARAGRALEEYLRKKNHCLPISEPDFHQMFAESVVAGRPNSKHQPEIVTGLHGVKESLIADLDRSPVFDNPRFSHCVLDDPGPRSQTESAAATPIHQRLKDAATAEDAASILRQELLLRLAAMLQASGSSIDENVPLIHLGVDSLIAIEIRSWFIKELSVDLPALKTLSGCTATELCHDVVEKLFSGGGNTGTDMKESETGNTGGRGKRVSSTPKEAFTTPGAGRTSASAENRNRPNRESAGGESETWILVNPLEETAASSDLVRVCLPEMGQERAALTAKQNKVDHNTSSTASITREKLSTLNRHESGSGSITPVSTPGSSGGEKTLTLPQQLVYTDIKPMSYSQSRLWFLARYSENPASYNVVLSYDIRGPLSIPRFQKAFQAVVSRHQVFRTCFFMQAETGEGRQGILEKSPIRLEHRTVANKGEIQEEFDRIQNHAFEPELGRAFAASLLTQTSSWSTFIFGYSHIVMDGSSASILLQDLDEAYRTQRLEASVNEYTDFAASQRLLVEGGSLGKEMQFWKEELSPLPEVLPLLDTSLVRSRLNAGASGTHTVHAGIPYSDVLKIKKICQKLGITAFHFHLAAVQSLLFKFLATDDICIGIADANRLDQRFLRTIGMFLNLLPLRFRRRAGQMFADIVADTSRKAMSALENSRLPFEVLLEELNIQRSLAHTPLFQVFVNYRMGAFQRMPLGECELQHGAVSDTAFAYDLLVTITEPTRESCVVSFTSRDDLYTEDACSLLIKSFIHLLGQLCDDPFRTLDRYSLFSKMDARLGLDLGQGPRQPCFLQDTLPHCVNRLGQSIPESIAVKDGYGNTLTYGQLSKHSRLIAGALTAAAVARGSFVAVLMHPGSHTIAVLLAILRLGAIYVPLDLINPLERLKAISENCRPAAVVCQQNTLHLAKRLCTEDTVAIDLTFLPEIDLAPPEDRSTLHVPAFALYTSGSSGTPKGVLISQGNILEAAAGTFEGYCLGRGETVLQQSSLGFDLSLYQIVRALVSGSTLIVVPKATRRNPAELAKLMLAEAVTLTIATPSEYSVMLSYGSHYLRRCSSWRVAASAGENMSVRVRQLFHQLDSPNLTVLNWFGPTEAGFYSTGTISFRDTQGTPADEFPSIGRPMPNVSVYILDESLQPVPTGFPGEMCVGGPGIALGYIGDEELTNSKFVPNTFASPEELGAGWDRLYRTGDRGRILPDGTIVFLGRAVGDSLVKLRGFRIDLGDVANNILSASRGYLADAAVSVRGDPPFLVAFVVFPSDRMPADVTGFLNDLRSDVPLPDYMRPAMMIPVSCLPMTPNGKRDRAALDALPLPKTVEAELEIHLTDLEVQLKRLWIETLPSLIDASQIGRATSFFQVGGSSILMMRLQLLIREAFSVKLSLANLIQFNTLADMAANIEARRRQTEREATVGVAAGSDEAKIVNGTRQEKRGPRGSQLASATAEIDWEEETTVPEHILARVGPDISKPRSGSKTILLTGATELLGRAVLQRLVEDSRVAKVHCIAVPMAGELDSYPKVETHIGSLSMPQLGLCEAELDMLSQEVDVILHANAEGSFLSSYQSLRLVSLGVLRHLTWLAAPRRIPIHYVSSSRVILFTGAPSLREVSVAQFHPPTDGSEGLAAARWACERFLQSAADKLGTPVGIHRCCAVTSDNAPPTDVLYSILKYCKLTKAVPVLEKIAGFIDYAPVETVAAAIAGALVGEKRNGDLVTFIHHTSGRRVTPQNLRKHFESTEGCPFEEVALTEWLRRAKDMGMGDFPVAILDALRSRNETFYFPLLLKTEER
ncbi:hypothetical protein DL770_003295 [Monosporascus sp. CRB-9-2]|nr:hypothetical protein DL770_003295 [Monosporascus sp. CRB-9-2]